MLRYNDETLIEQSVESNLWNALKTRAIMQSHWVAFLFLLPAVIMLILHHRLGLSDAMNMPTPPGEREARVFNLAMATVFWLGVAAYFLHAFSLWSRGWRWFWAKMIFLALCWGAILMLA